MHLSVFEYIMDVKTIIRVATKAEIKVQTYTTPACAFIPQGIFQTTVPYRISAFSLVIAYKQL